MKEISIAVFASLMIAGCNPSQSTLDVGGVTKLEINHPRGEAVVTNSAVIHELGDAMLKGRRDHGAYKTAKNILITGYRGDNIAWRISAGDPFVDVNGRQYRCREFHAVLNKMLMRPKTDTQPAAGATGEPVAQP